MNASEDEDNNIREFNEVATVIFAQLYASFPVPRLDRDEVANILGRPLSGPGRENMFAHTLSWLVHQGYVASLGTMPHELAFLTDKALAAMNVVPPTLGRSLGSELVKATKQASSENGKNKIAEVAGSFIGSIIGSVTKSLGGT
jgi:hypothetical protein